MGESVRSFPVGKSARVPGCERATAFLGEAVDKLDGVYGQPRCPEVANQKQLAAATAAKA